MEITRNNFRFNWKQTTTHIVTGMLVEKFPSYTLKKGRMKLKLGLAKIGRNFGNFKGISGQNTRIQRIPLGIPGNPRDFSEA